MPAGRPTDYKPEYCEQIIELGKQGKSVAQFACFFNIVRQTMLDWCRAHPEFMDAFTRAKQFSQDWWENKAQVHMLENKDGIRINHGVWSRSMAARFPDDYRDKTEVEHKGQVTLTHILDEIDGQSTDIPSDQG